VIAVNWYILTSGAEKEQSGETSKNMLDKSGGDD
jgi:hypothetical protein